MRLSKVWFLLHVGNRHDNENTMYVCLCVSPKCNEPAMQSGGFFFFFPWIDYYYCYYYSSPTKSKPETRLCFCLPIAKPDTVFIFLFLSKTRKSGIYFWENICFYNLANQCGDFYLSTLINYKNVE